MSEELRTLNSQNIWDAIDLLNRSSRDSSLRYDLDLFGFGRLTRYWNISHDYSLICYVDGKPVALMLNCVELETRDAYTFYWGVLPEFRTGKIAISLVETACQKLYDDGYVMHYAVAVPDRPVRRYRFVKFHAERVLIDMEARFLTLPPPDSLYSVRAITIDELPPSLRDDPVHWCQRLAFLQRAKTHLKFLGAFDGELLKSYAVLVSHSTNTTLSDIRLTDSSFSAAFELLRSLTLDENYRPPLTVNYVLENSQTHTLLTAAGFTVRRQLALLSRNLRTTVLPAVV